MFSMTTFEYVRALKSIRASNLHLPPIIRLGTDNQNPPTSRPIRKRVLDARNHIRLHVGTARVVHFHRNGHALLILDTCQF